MYQSSFARVCVACALLLKICAVDAADALRLEEAVTRALERNPDLAVFGYELKAQQARAVQAGARPETEVGFLVENALGTGRHSSFDAAETTLSLGFLLEHVHSKSAATRPSLALTRSTLSLISVASTQRSAASARNRRHRRNSVLHAADAAGPSRAVSTNSPAKRHRCSRAGHLSASVSNFSCRCVLT